MSKGTTAVSVKGLVFRLYDEGTNCTKTPRGHGQPVLRKFTYVTRVLRTWGGGGEVGTGRVG